MRRTVLPILLVLAVACEGQPDGPIQGKADTKPAKPVPAPAAAPEQEKPAPTPEPAVDDAKATENAKLPVEKIELAQLHEGYFADKGTWVGRRVELTAIYVNTNTITSGAEPTTSLSLTTDLAQLRGAPGGSCMLQTGEDPGRVMQGSVLSIEAVVQGDMFDDVQLSQCHIVEVREPSKVAEAK